MTELLNDWLDNTTTPFQLLYYVELLEDPMHSDEYLSEQFFWNLWIAVPPEAIHEFRAKTEYMDWKAFEPAANAFLRSFPEVVIEDEDGDS